MSGRNTLSNSQFRPRSMQSGNLGRGSTTMKVPKLTKKGGTLGIKRNARSGKMYHHAGNL